MSTLLVLRVESRVPPFGVCREAVTFGWRPFAYPESMDIRYVTVGRKKRKRKKGAGTGVKVKSHTRSPRGPNGGKKRVRVDGYGRGKPPAKKRRKR